MTWAQRRKRVFGIDVGTCEHGGAAAKIVASVEAPDAIRAMQKAVNLGGLGDKVDVKPGHDRNFLVPYA